LFDSLLILLFFTVSLRLSVLSENIELVFVDHIHFLELLFQLLLNAFNTISFDHIYLLRGPPVIKVNILVEVGNSGNLVSLSLLRQN
jgi:hypothetical protein